MMDNILRGPQLDEVAEGIFSCISQAERPSSYDNKVDAYDLVVGNRFYNRLVWGNWPSDYREFCEQALASSPDGVFLDAGCGSLVFTASVYSKIDHRPIVLLDRSIGMLIKGRDRIRKIKGYVPDNIFFLQADIFSLPFHDRVFDTVAAFGVLHLFNNKSALLAELERVKRDGGQIFFSSLAGNNKIGTKYLEVLRQAGEVASCHTSVSIENLLSTMPFKYRMKSKGNMLYAQSE